MKRTALYALSIYALMIGFGIYLNTVHGEESPAPAAKADSSTQTPAAPAPASVQSRTDSAADNMPNFVWSYKTEAPMRIRKSKSCREYLTACERSCKERGDMFKFHCIGQAFQPYQEHYRCQCADDLHGRQQVVKVSELVK